MGGYGALKLGLAKPENFAAIISLSGAISVGNRMDDLLMIRKAKFWEGVFGPLDQIKGSVNDPQYLLEELVKSDPFNYTKRMLDYAVQLRAIPTNPMNSVVKPRKKHDKTFTNNNFFNEKQLHNFIKCIKKDYEEKNPRAFMVLWLAVLGPPR